MPDEIMLRCRHATQHHHAGYDSYPLRKEPCRFFKPNTLPSPFFFFAAEQAHKHAHCGFCHPPQKDHHQSRSLVHSSRLVPAQGVCVSCPVPTCHHLPPPPYPLHLSVLRSQSPTSSAGSVAAAPHQCSPSSPWPQPSSSSSSSGGFIRCGGHQQGHGPRNRRFALSEAAATATATCWSRPPQQPPPRCPHPLLPWL